MRKSSKRSGFTLVEILIVVIILGILAAIVIPQFSDASSEARLSSMDTNRRAISSQCELYKAQHGDVYPWDDGAGALETDAEIWRKLTTVTDVTGAAGADFGPYMQAIPENPHVVDGVVAFGTDSTVTVSSGIDWFVDIATGAIDGPRP